MQSKKSKSLFNFKLKMNQSKIYSQKEMEDALYNLNIKLSADFYKRAVNANNNHIQNMLNMQTQQDQLTAERKLHTEALNNVNKIKKEAVEDFKYRLCEEDLFELIHNWFKERQESEY